MSESLAVKYRPKTFDEVVSQSSIVKTLIQQLNTNKIKNAYLFCGASGCGKTTAARIFANLINNNIGSPIEIDAASNNGVDNVKQLIKSASERSLDSKYKVYIIDEAHMLTIQAWNAFLKCIEEPPSFTVFIFCTTDPQKIPNTILNRVMRFNFQRISSDKIKERLEYICKQEHFSNFTDACEYISRISNNQMRDAIATLEKCASYNSDLSIENVLMALGDYSYNTFFKLVNYIIDGNCEETLNVIQDIFFSGSDSKLFVDQFLSFCMDVEKYCIFKTYEVTSFPSTCEEMLKNSTNFDSADRYYLYIIDKLMDLKNVLKTDLDPKTTVEIKLLQICRNQ